MIIKFEVNKKNYFLELLFLTLYLFSLKKFDVFSVFWTRREAFFVEGPLVALVYFLLVRSMKKGLCRYFLAAMPVVTFYLLFEVYYKIWNTPFKFITVGQLPELLNVLEAKHTIIGVIIVFIFLITILSAIDYKSYKKTSLCIVLLVFVPSIVYFSPQTYLSYFSFFGGEIEPLRDRDNIHKNGRLSMSLFWEAERIDAILKLKPLARNIDNSEELRAIDMVKVVPGKKNVHLIVLESFFDPSLFREVVFSEPPLHPKLIEVFNGQLCLSRSPVFGGRSAQAEFEVLTGMPAFSEFSDVDFNIFNGSPTKGLPWILRKSGYLTIATNSYMMNAFNVDNAYRSLFFEEIYFPKEYAKGRPTYIERGDLDKKIFMPDEYLLKKNLEFIKEKISNNPNKPIFNYVLGVDGHWPFDIQPGKKQERIKVLSPTDFDKELLEKFVNQLYYRSKAVADYVEDIKKIDHDSVIIIIGDHLPRLELGLWKDMGPDLYKKLKYIDTSKVDHEYSLVAGIDGDMAIDFKNMNHYNVKDYVLNIITDGQYCVENACYIQEKELLRKKYTEIMAMGVLNKFH